MRAQVSDATAQLVDSEVRALMGRAYAACRRLLQQHQDTLEAFANALLAKEVLLADDIQHLLGDRPLAAQENAALYHRDMATTSTTTTESPKQAPLAVSVGAGVVAASTATSRHSLNLNHQHGRRPKSSRKGNNNVFFSASRSVSPQPELTAAVHAVNAALLMEEQQEKGSSLSSSAASNTYSSNNDNNVLRQSSRERTAAVVNAKTSGQALSSTAMASPLTWIANCGRILQPAMERFGSTGAAFAVAAACHYLRSVV